MSTPHAPQVQLPRTAPRRSPPYDARTGSGAEVTLQLLHGFELRRCGDVVPLPPSVQRVVAFLALRDRPVHRLHVAGTLWPDVTESHANASLRTALWRLGQLDGTVVVATSTHVGLSDGAVVDVRRTAVRAARILGGERGDGDSLQALGGAGELLPDWYEDWVLIERERLRQLVIRSLEHLSADARAEGRYAEAAEAGLAAVGLEPLRESAHRLVVRAHLEDGNAVEAIRQYRLFARLLRGALGLEPSAAMRELLRGLPLGDLGYGVTASSRTA